MKKGSSRRDSNDLRAEYDLSRLEGGVRGKYYNQAMKGTNLVLLDPDLAQVFPNSPSVNRALRLVQEVATRTSRSARKARDASPRRHRDTEENGG